MLAQFADDLTNARSSRGGLAFDGTPASRAVAAMIGQIIGLDAFSVSFVVTIPADGATVGYNIARVSGAASGSSTGSSLRIMTDAFAGLAFEFRNAAFDGYIAATVPISAYAGKRVHIVFTRSGGTAVIYLNGISVAFAQTTGGTATTFAQSIDSSFLTLGDWLTNGKPVQSIYTASFYNLALSATDVQEVYELGGAVPERFKFSAAKYISDFSAGLDGWTDNNGGQTLTTGNVDGVAGVDDTLRISYAGGAGAMQSQRTATPFALGKMYRVTTDYYADAAAGPTFLYFGAFNDAFTNQVPLVSGAWQTGVRFTYAFPFATGRGHVSGGGLAAGKSIYFKNMTVVQLGAVCHFDGDDLNAGYQWQDRSSNNLHAIRTTTGNAPTLPTVGAFSVRGVSDGTTTTQQLGGGTLLPPNCQLLRIRARAQSGTPFVTLGNVGGGSQYVASVQLSTAWKDLTIALSGGIVTTASPLWFTASTANVVEVHLSAESLSA